MPKYNSSIADQIMCMAWYLKRCPDADAMAPFYEKTLGIPVMRGRNPVYFLWGGETFVYELKGDKVPWPERDQDPLSAPMVGMFRVRDLDDLCKKLENDGIEIIYREDRDHSIEAHIIDPDGQLVGFRQAKQGSSLDVDRRFDLISQREQTYVYDWPSMGSDIIAWDWVVRRVSDLQKATAFYQEFLGLNICDQTDDSVLFDAGDNSIFEIRPGGARQRVPEDRGKITNSVVFRLRDHAIVNAAAKAEGLKIVNDTIEFNSARLSYICDPDDQIIGFEERFEPHKYGTWRAPFAEDIEAERRWKSYQMDPDLAIKQRYSRET